MTQKGIFGVFGPWGPKMAILAILAVRAIWGPKLLVLDGPPALGGHIWPLGPICQYGLWGPGLRGHIWGPSRLTPGFVVIWPLGAQIWPLGAPPGAGLGGPFWDPFWDPFWPPQARIYTAGRGKWPSHGIWGQKGVPKWVQIWPLGAILGPQTHHVLAHFGSHSGTPFGQGPSRIKWDFGPFGLQNDPKRGPKYDPKWVDSGVPGQPQAPGGPSQNPNVSREF